MQPLLLLLLIVLCAAHAAEVAAPAALGAYDAEMLASLIPRPIIDPHGKTWVGTAVPVLPVRGPATTATRHGWLLGDPQPHGGTVCFTDGELITLGEQDVAEPRDFATDCRRFCDSVAPFAGDAQAQVERASAREQRLRLGIPEVPPLALAAWLHALGQDDLAARMLAVIRSAQPVAAGTASDLVTLMRGELSWDAYSRMVNAFVAHDDGLAVLFGRRIIDLYPDHYDLTTKRVVADIERRQKVPPVEPPAAWTPPDDWATWEVTRKISSLIDGLESALPRNAQGARWSDLRGDARVRQLALIGDPAIPALIDAIEHDQRLTRVVWFTPGTPPVVQLVPVKELADAAVVSILRLPSFQVRFSSEDAVTADATAVAALVGRLRAYWKRLGDQPLENRLMATVVDATATTAERQEAAGALVRVGQRLLSPTAEIAAARQANMLAMHDPTVAEAILHLLDVDLAPSPDTPGSQGTLNERLIYCLLALNDRRIAPVLAQRAAQQPILRNRCRLAAAAESLGAPDEIAALAHDVIQGRMWLPHDSQELRLKALVTILETLGNAASPLAHHALGVLAANDHPWHKDAVAALFSHEGNYGSGLFNHTDGIAFVASALWDDSATGTIWGTATDHIWSKVPISGDMQQEFPADVPRARWAGTAIERRSDLTAQALAEVVAGIPDSHPLWRDREDRLDIMRERFRTLGPSLHLLSQSECDALRQPHPSEHRSSLKFGFTPQPLSAPATTADVAAGRAVFFLGTGARAANLGLPARATLRLPGKEPAAVIVLQAEDDAAGKRHLGILAIDAVLTVDGDQVSDISALSTADAP
jgi:hypothetical protein